MASLPVEFLSLSVVITLNHLLASNDFYNSNACLISAGLQGWLTQENSRQQLHIRFSTCFGFFSASPVASLVHSLQHDHWLITCVGMRLSLFVDDDN